MFSIILCLHQPLFNIPDKSVSKASRQKWLLELCEQLVDNYIYGESEVQALVEQTQTLQDATNQPFRCRAADYQLVYVHHSRRVRYGKCYDITLYPLSKVNFIHSETPDHNTHSNPHKYRNCSSCLLEMALDAFH